MSALPLWGLVLLPAVAGAALALAGPRAERVAVPVSLVTATATAVLAGVAAVQRPSLSVPFVAGAPFALAVDALAALVLPAVAVVTLLVLVFAAGDVHASRARFHGLVLLFAAAVGVTATATTLPALLLAWEVMGATSYALIGFPWSDRAHVAGGEAAFVTTRTADLGLYAAAAAGLAGGAGLRLDDLASADGAWQDLAAAGVLVAALGKAAQLPFSAWLSRAMLGPSPVSALLHSAAMVAMGGYLLLRAAPLLEATGWAATAAAWAGAATALLLGVVALAQRDLKQLLAASTAAQLGFVVLAAGLGAVAGGAAHLVAHAATKALLFLAAGAWLSALGTRRLEALRGAGRRWVLVGATAAVGALSLAGVAPLALWATKDAVLAAAREEAPALYAVGLAAAALSAAYAGKVLLVVWRPAPDGVEDGWDDERPGTRHVGRLEQAPLVVLALGAALLGALALPPAGDALRRALGGSTPAAGAAELALSAVLALAAVAAVARWGSPEPRWALDWLGLERATRAVAVRPVLALAEGLARFDDRVLDRAVHGGAGAALAAARALAGLDDRRVDGAVRAASRGGLLLGAAAARADTGGVDRAVEATAGGARRAGRLARRPQTGLLHEYYAQAAAVLAAGVLLLVLVR
ncbi:proton-conducting transporter membrane subunit [Vallicoccus soli]|uniref:NADH-quinone oxidoreductase subunit L n=1 Tax=Vallicoccus soli TaxID=2339232 RepID=A0A3A3Z3W6_9ACTN|nr:proton-conducting transporter membrane subunit [Vallicoccus soli]RJK97598.1 NADH-quinone oxidoreductase subunit L [Vallicoccus soli]